MNDDVRLSVVLPVHAGIDVEAMSAAIRSVINQTYAPYEVLVVEDGPLPQAHQQVLRDLQREHQITRLPLTVNRGAGIANDVGLRAASGEWIAKMDADDICLPDRFEKQMLMVRDGRLDVVGGAMAEFSSADNVVHAVRVPPRSHDDIARRMRMNNPMNHSTTVFRRELAVHVGGYPAYRFMQDYDLFARMLSHGARMANTSDVLVLFRADRNVYRRRRSAALFTLEWHLQHNLVRYGLVGRGRALLNVLLRWSFRLLPAPVLRPVSIVLFGSRRHDIVGKPVAEVLGD